VCREGWLTTIVLGVDPGVTTRMQTTLAGAPFPRNFERAATAVIRSRHLLEEALAEVQLASEILSRIEDERVPWGSDPGERISRLGWLNGAASLVEASSRSLQHAWPPD
jgi:hypothetical protein